MSMTRPFLKWPGGKYRLVSVLQQYLPKRTHLIEPFVGAGALSLNSQYPHLILNDLNPDLINLYQQLKQSGDHFIREAKRFFIKKYNCKTSYYRLRAAFNTCHNNWDRALLFLYLNRHGYNGLCRYNLKGGYNVPFGEYKQPYFPEKEMLAFHARIQQATLHCEDYRTVLRKWSKRPEIKQSVIYCDPPYTPLSKTANFTSYAGQRFSEQDQLQLAHLAKKLVEKGAIVIISNHDTPFTRALYQGATLYTIEVTRSISCRAQTRQKISEIIAYFD